MSTVKRKLIEVALPLEAINRESAREKSIRQGHPSTLHLWWARRPLAAARAVLFAQLVDDPSSHPEEFPTDVAQSVERKRLFDLIERLVVWENINDEALYREAHEEILKSTGGRPPAILDPFAGGGSIPLEAQRLGLEAHASDLNPVAVLINKALIEIPPRWSGHRPVFPGAAESRMGDWQRASGLAEDVLRYGSWMRDQAEQRIGHMYPEVERADGSTAPVIAWLWARTVTCPNPACQVDTLLLRSWWLSKRSGNLNGLRVTLEGGRPELSILHGDDAKTAIDEEGTITRSGAVCVACKTAIPLAHIRTEGVAGRLGSRMTAVVFDGGRKRGYVVPDAVQTESAVAQRRPDAEDLYDVPLSTHPQYMGAPRYGLTTVGSLFPARQLVAATTFSALIREAIARVETDGALAGMPDSDAREYAAHVGCYLAATLDKCLNLWSSCASWMTDREALRETFARQALPMLWDYAEPNPFGSTGGSWDTCLDKVRQVIMALPASGTVRVSQRDARAAELEQSWISTDPPYYDNVPYSDLSDYFYPWLRRALAESWPDLFATMTTPKRDELVADYVRLGGKDKAAQYFESGFQDVFERIAQASGPDDLMTVYYAFKQTGTSDEASEATGWETMLSALLGSGLEVTATWPVRTEGAGRIRSTKSNALASSIVLACRRRSPQAQATTRRGFIAELKSHLPTALRQLQQGSVAPVDLAQAAIGPGMAVFSSHAKVVEADGADMTVRTALALINQVLDEVLTEQEGDFDADTRFCVKWFTQFGWTEGGWGEADVLARATNTSVDGLVRGGVFDAIGGKARLLSPGDLAEHWDPVADERVSDWEVAVRLAKALSEQGAEHAAQLMAAAGQRRDLDTVKELAYLLFSLADKRGWTQTAVLFNGLGTAWNDLETAARSGSGRPIAAQESLTFDDEN